MAEKLTREELVKALAALDERDRKNDAEMAPFREISRQIDEERQALLEANEAEVEGHCICGQLVLVGDRHCRTTDGEIMCVECAPTWADAVQSLEGSLAEGYEDEDLSASLEVARARVSAGRGNEKVC